MIKIAVVEDGQNYYEAILKNIREYEKDNHEEIEVEYFTDGLYFLEAYNGKFDIILLDIEMKLTNGMDVAKKLRAMGDNSPIIFITNMAQYAVSGYEVNAMGFIVKPISYYQFSACLTKAIEFIKRRTTKYLTITLKDGVIKIYLNDIAYVEVIKHSILFHTAEKIIETRGTMYEIAEKLQENNFALCDRSFLVNLKYVTEVSQNTVSVRVGNRKDSLPISRPKKKEFMDTLTVYLAQEGFL